MLSLRDIEAAGARIGAHLHRTPLVSSRLLNEWMSFHCPHEIFFKADCLQRTGSFKARGALNTLLWLKERNELPGHVVAYSSGNHGQAVAWAASLVGVQATIFMPSDASRAKLLATASYGAQVRSCSDRVAAEQEARAFARRSDAYLAPPFDHDQVICGQGTALLEAMEQAPALTAVMVPCGGGGLLSGSVIAGKELDRDLAIFGAEPSNANDAAASLRAGRIIPLTSTPLTLADGVRTPSISPRTFGYLQRANGIIEVREREISYWTQWLSHLLKLTVEPTSTLGMAAASRWLRQQRSPQRLLVVLTGGNLDVECRSAIWATDMLEIAPRDFVDEAAIS